MTSTGSAEEPAGAAPRGGARRFRAAPGRGVHLADLAVAAGTVLYVVLALLPWFRVDGIAVAGGSRSPALTVNGFDLGMIVGGAVLLVLATAWTLVLTRLPVPFPPAEVTAGLAAAAFLSTLTGWLRASDLGFTAAGLLTVLVSAAVLTCAALQLVAQLREQSRPVGAASTVRPAGPPNGSAVHPAAGAAADQPPGSGDGTFGHSW